MLDAFNIFISDMIHMTETEKFIKYWWLWILILASVFLYFHLRTKFEGRTKK